MVVITGGSRGLGLALARLFVDEGARVVLLARDMAELGRARAELDARGRGAVLTLRCDVRRRADVRAAVDAVIDRWRSIDVLVNNAGVVQAGPLDGMEREDFENAMATHFWGPLHLILETVPRHASPRLRPHRQHRVNRRTDGRAPPRAVQREQGRAGRPVRRGARGARSARDPRHDRHAGLMRTAPSIAGLTTSVDRAARKIVEACRYGNPALTMTAGAKVAAAANAIMPAAVARAMMLVARLLPAVRSSPSTVSSLVHKTTNCVAPL